MSSAALLTPVECLLALIESASVLYLANGFFPRKSAQGLYVGSFAALALLCVLSAIFLEPWLLARLHVLALLYSLWILLNFDGSALKCCIASVLFLSFHILLDGLFLNSAAALMRETVAELRQSSFIYYTTAFSAKIVTLFLFVLVRQWAQRRFRRQKAAAADWIRVAVIPFSVLVISACMNVMLYQNPGAAAGFFLCHLLLVLDVMCILLLGHMEQHREALLEKAILQQNLHLETEHVRALELAYADQRKQTHDINNQLSVLRGLAEQGAAREEFERYLGQILATELPRTLYVNTHRTVVDVIVSQKLALAREQNTALELQLDDLADFPLPDDALVVVLTNLLDNALEACAKIPDANARKIILKMQIKSAAAYLYIENSTAQAVQIYNNRIATTKSDALAHGYGLKNVCAMLEKNRAVYAMSCRDEHIFCFSAKLPPKAGGG